MGLRSRYAVVFLASGDFRLDQLSTGVRLALRQMAPRTMVAAEVADPITPQRTAAGSPPGTRITLGSPARHVDRA